MEVCLRPVLVVIWQKILLKQFGDEEIEILQEVASLQVVTGITDLDSLLAHDVLIDALRP